MNENVNLQNEKNVIIATFEIEQANQRVTLKNLTGMTQIDWGDGIVNNALTHTYVETRNYTCKIYDVTSIGEDAFYECANLTSVVIPNSVMSIGDWAFGDCDSLTSVVIPDNVTTIGEAAFCDCTRLTSVVIGNSVTTIGMDAFYGCSNLTSVVIGDSVTSIGEFAFEDCSRLANVYYKGTAEEWNSISIGSDNSSLTSSKRYYYIEAEVDVPTDGGNYWHYDENGEITIWEVCPVESESSKGLEYELNSDGVSYSVVGIGSCTDTDIVISSTYFSLPVISIGWHAFEFRPLTSVKIPDSITSIDGGAFSFCSSLTSVEIPDSVTSIGNQAFYNCHSLTSIVIPDSVTSIGDQAFYNTSYYNDSSNWEDGVLYIGKHLIKANKDISGEYIIKKGTLYISSGAFAYHNSLTSVVIPDSVTSIGDGAFGDCDSLTSVVIPDSVTSMGSSTFEGCFSLTSIVIGNSVTSIGEDAFSGCYNLTSVVIGDSVESIGKSAFYSCYRLTSVVIPDSVTKIGDYAFSDCYNLTSVVIGNSVTTIGSYAFYGCYKIVEVINNSTNITVTKGSTNNGYVGYYALSVSNCDSSYVSKLTTDNGYIVYTEDSKKILVGYSGTETDPVIPDYITEIYKHAFYYCSSLTSVVIPDGVITIGSSAFYNCHSLTNVEIGNSVTTIGMDAFWPCYNLTSIVIGNSVTSIGDWAFFSCDRLTHVTFRSQTPLTTNVLNRSQINNSNPTYYVPMDAIEVYQTAWTGIVDPSKILPNPEDILLINLAGLKTYHKALKEKHLDKKLDKTGGLVGGDLSVQGNLNVAGTTTTKDTETVLIKDNIIVANSDGNELLEEAGFAVKTWADAAYGIMYDPVGDGVKIGLGIFDENGKFEYTEGEDQFLATRDDEITDGNLVKWDDTKKKLVDAGNEYVKFTDCANLALIIEKTRTNKFLAPYYIDKIIKVGMTTNKEEWTDDSTDENGELVKGDKTKARELIGAVGFNDIATRNKAGVVRAVGDNYGISINETNGNITLATATNNEITNKTSEKALKVKQIDYAWKMSAIDNKEEWTDEEKAAACETIGAVKQASVVGQGALLYGMNSKGESQMIKLSSGENAFTRGGVPISSTNGAIYQAGIMPETATNYDKYTVPRFWIEDNFVAKQLYSQTAGTPGTDGLFRGRVYAVKFDGTEETIPIANQAQKHSICWRDAQANIYVEDPTQDLHCINKRYVEGNFIAKDTSQGTLRLYGIAGDGSQVIYQMITNANNVVDGRIPRYELNTTQSTLVNDNCVLPTGTPLLEHHAANKKYVDDNFVAKFTNPDNDANRRYVLYSYQNGTQTVNEYSQNAKEFAIAQYTSGGNLKVADPRGETHATTKKYVDDLIASLQAQINELKGE